MMYRRLRLSSAAGKSTPQAIAVGLFADHTRLPAGYAELDQQLEGLLSEAIKRPEFSADAGQVITLYPSEAGPSSSGKKQSKAVVSRVYLLGLGEEKGFTSNVLRVACAGLGRAAFAAQLTTLQLELTAGVGEHLDAEAVGRAAGEGLVIGQFEFDDFRGKGAGEGPRRKAKPIDLALHGESAMRKGLQRGLTVGDSVNLARTLAATPPNVANPSYLVTQSRKLARQSGLQCTIIDAKQAQQLKLNGLLAVGAAGSTAPALICLEHRPKQASRAKGQAAGPILLVGKAVTFDTGGYSLKPPASMDGMKYDKCGGMAVIGAMHAIASLNLPQHVVGLIPTAENMVDEKAYRPGDILTMHNGVTVEVTNTDAEGRLILADALAYGVKRYKPRAIIDLATLTGGVVVALGSYCAGLFCNDEALQDHLITAGQDAGERLWTLPLWDEHKKQLKGTHSDIVNSAGREAHPIQGAAFLSYFIDPDDPVSLPKTAWAHVDIAGVSDVKDNKNPLYPKGPTGFGVRLLVRTLEQWAR